MDPFNPQKYVLHWQVSTTGGAAGTFTPSAGLMGELVALAGILNTPVIARQRVPFPVVVRELRAWSMINPGFAVASTFRLFNGVDATGVLFGSITLPANQRTTTPVRVNRVLQQDAELFADWTIGANANTGVNIILQVVCDIQVPL